MMEPHAHPVAGWVCPICGTGVSPLVPEHCTRGGQQVAPVLIDSPIQRLSPVDLAAIRARPPEGNGPPGPGNFGAGYGVPVGVPGPAVPYGIPYPPPPWEAARPLYQQPAFYPPPVAPSPMPTPQPLFQVEPPTIETWDNKPWVRFHADDPYIVDWLRNSIQAGRLVPALGEVDIEFYLSTFPPPAEGTTAEFPAMWVSLEIPPGNFSWLDTAGQLASLDLSEAHMSVLSAHYEYLANQADRARKSMEPPSSPPPVADADIVYKNKEPANEE